MPAVLRAALVLHGKLGSLNRGQGWTRAVDGGAPSLDVAVICYAGYVRHLVEANRGAYSIDVFGHSWSPSMGPALDALFKPKVSRHEEEALPRNRDLCRTIMTRLRQLSATGALGAVFSNFASVGRGANSCERTASHLLGMQRAIQLKAAFEAQHGFQYDAVIVSRWDVLWSRPFMLGRLDLSGGAFVVPHFCTHAHHVDHRSSLERNLTGFRKGICGGSHGPGQVPTASTACHPIHRPCSGDLSARAREVYLLDWWFVSSSRAADGFGLVADAPLYANYTVLNSRLLNKPEHPRPTIMGHAYWGLHMLYGLRAPLRFTGHVGMDFTLGRVYEHEGCRAMADTCEATNCAATDVLRRPWHSETVHPPYTSIPPPEKELDFTYGAAHTRHSCGVGYFYCDNARGKKSRMCKDDQAAREPMDRNLGRLAWVECTDGMCTRVASDPYGARCAGAMLAAWTAIWRLLPPSDTNITRELFTPRSLRYDAFGSYEPRHSDAALAALITRVTELFPAPKTPEDGASLRSIEMQCEAVLKAAQEKDHYYAKEVSASLKGLGGIRTKLEKAKHALMKVKSIAGR